MTLRQGTKLQFIRAFQHSFHIFGLNLIPFLNKKNKLLGLSRTQYICSKNLEFRAVQAIFSEIWIGPLSIEREYNILLLNSYI